MMRTCSLVLSLFFAVILAVLALGPALAGEDGPNGRPVKLLTTVPIPGTLSPLKAFDISWIDPESQLYYLADRSNASVDVVDARTNQFVKQITAGFKGLVFKTNPNGPGQVADNDRSGPNGVVVSGHWLFVSDAPAGWSPSTSGPTRKSTRPPLAEPPICVPMSWHTIRTMGCSSW